MKTCRILIVFICLLYCSESKHHRGARQDDESTTIDGVKLDGPQRDHYGLLMVKVNDVWTPVCDHKFKQQTALVACKQMNFKDGQYFPGSKIDSQSSTSVPVSLRCIGNETKLDECHTAVHHNCSSQTFVTLYCSKEIIQTKENFDVRIHGTVRNAKQIYGALEVNKFGFWGPVCHSSWTNKEANTACRHLGYHGGVAHYSTVSYSVPLVLGAFKCGSRNKLLDDCEYKGFGHDIGCQHTLGDGAEHQVAGVLCYDDEDGIQFRLSNQWYGELQVKYNGNWGSVCSNNWDKYDTKTICNQLGYVDGQPSHDIPTSVGQAFVDDVNCTGNEESLLLCDYTPGWKTTEHKCSSAYVTCNKTTCGSIDIRFESEMNRLKYCNVVEGNVTIVFIETIARDDFTKYACPGLIEITDFLLLFRVYALHSLEVLFPNLAIIRGDRLFVDYYSLFIFEMPDLADLGLKSLVTISRGSVRLEKNPNLCYIETIDWPSITKDHQENYFKNNRAIYECWNQCPSDCTSTLQVDKYVPRCWNHKVCQKIPACPAKCLTGVCNGNDCCHDNCVAGCTGPSALQCTACRHVTFQDSDLLPSCLEECPSRTFVFRDRRCLMDSECKNINISRNYVATNDDYSNLKLVTLADDEDDSKSMGKCVSECPEDYNIDSRDANSCIQCKGKCRKVKAGNVQIDSISDTYVLKGYNVIEGYLEIKLMNGDQISAILEENLADLEEVGGYLKIQYSYALLTLHFLKNLRSVGGSGYLMNGYVLFVFNNENLQELFLDSVTENLKLGDGKVFFHSNRKLCYNKITQFLTTVGRNMTNISIDDVSMETNGDLVPCDIQKLNVTLPFTFATMAFVRWTLMTKVSDPRRILGYMIYWKETNDESLSKFEGRDACNEDSWDSIIACTYDDDCRDFGIAMISGLKPWTKYALYIKVMTVSSSLQGAISDIIYFRTNADSPTSPLNLKIEAEEPGELHVTWDPPSTLNGNENIVYVVEWRYKQIDTELIETRDYCLNPITSNLFTKGDEIEANEKEENATKDDNCCCQETGKELEMTEWERKRAIDFNDYLQNMLYVKGDIAIPVEKEKEAEESETFNITALKARAMGNTSTPETEKTAEPEKVDDDKINDLDKTAGSKLALEKSRNKFDLVNERGWTIRNLGYFTHMNVEVRACNRDTNNASVLLCSPQAIIFGRTMPNETADSINASLISWRLANNKTGSVYVKWKEPEHPNGLVLAYDIIVKNINIAAKPMLICITAKEYDKTGKTGIEVEKLSPGNYTLKIRAISLAGNGSWSDEIYFQVPQLPDTEGQVNIWIVILICVLVILFCTASLIVWCVIKKRSEAKEAMMFSENPDYFVYTPDEWEIDRKKVFIVHELGHGSFGMVYEGYVEETDEKNPKVVRKIPVAIKTTNENSNERDRHQFLQEASVMKRFCCHHVVKLIGVVSQDQPAYVLMELMSNGDLKSFLRLHRPDNEENNDRKPPTLRQFLQMAAEIADGMAYLADNKFVHRDLAARNCMVGEDLTVKIGDFGMTRDIYDTDYYRKGSRGLLPVRWMPPESLRDGVFTSMTDVWSFGVVLWEMATLAEQPYQGLSNEEVMTYVLSGRIMDSPEGCPVRLYDLMVKCWRFRPKQRPTFKEIIEMLIPDLDKRFEEVSYFFSEENMRIREACDTNIYENQLPQFYEIDDNDDGYSDTPMNDYIEEGLPMLCCDEIDGPADSGVMSHAKDSNEQHGGNRRGNSDQNVSNSQANCDSCEENDCVHSLLNRPLDNIAPYPYDNSEENHSPIDENIDKFHPSFKQSRLVNGHVQSDIRTTIC